MSPDTLIASTTATAWELSRFGLVNLAAVKRPLPKPGPRDLLVRVRAVSLNYRDKLVAEGSLLPALKLPHVPASDAAGEVVAAGAEVRRFRPGDRVTAHFITDWIDGALPPAHHRPGGSTADGAVYGGTLGGPLPGVLADHILLHEEAAVATPASLGDIEASTLPVAALTAWFAFFETGCLKPGQTVVVQGTGGVALFGLQLARAIGARVIVTSRDAAKLARARALGAWQGIDTAERPAWDEAVLDMTAGRGADHILEIVGGKNMARSARALAAGGRISLIGLLDGLQITAEILPLMLKRAVVQGISVGHRKSFAAMNAAIETAGIKPVIDAVYSFERVPEAFAHLDRGPFGKIVITVP
jgi:NADPH:quinone reductase-like Zn-dependent oxidoreductase